MADTGRHREVGALGIRIVRYRTIGSVKEELRRLLEEEGALPVVPSREDRKLLLDLLGRQGLGVGRMGSARTWEGLLDLAAGWLDASGGRAERKRLLAPPERWLVLNALAAELEGAGGPAHPERYLEEIAASIQELLREDVSPRLLAEASCPEGAPLDCTGRGHSLCTLCRLYRGYMAYLERRGAADAASVATLARGFLQAAPAGGPAGQSPGHLAFIGFRLFTRSQLQLVRALHDAGKGITLVAPVTGEKTYDAADQLANRIVETVPPPEEEPVPGRIVEGGDLWQECETVARELRLWAAGVGDLAERPFPGWGDIAVVAAGESLPTVAEAFDRYRVPWNGAVRREASGESPWSLVERLMELHHTGWPGKAAWNALSHPVLPGPGIEEGEGAPPSPPPEGAGAWEARIAALCPAGEAALFRRVTALGAALEEGAAPLEILERLSALFEGPDGFTRRAAGLAGDELELDGAVGRYGAVERALRDRLEQSRRHRSAGLLLPVEEEPLSPAAARRYLRLLGRSIQLPPPLPTTESLRLYPVMPPALARSGLCIVMGCHGKAWPGKVGEQPFLDDHTRQGLHDYGEFSLESAHLPLRRERMEQKRAQFRRLLATAGGMLWLSAPLGTGGGKALPRSPYLEEIAGGADPWVAMMEDGHCVRSPGALLPSLGEPRIAGVELAREARRRPRRFDTPFPVFREGDTIHAGDLDIWEDCPFRFACMRVLDLDDPAPADRPDPAMEGNLLHALWERVWERYLKAEEPPRLTALAGELWGETVASVYPALRERFPGRELQLRRQVRDLAEEQQAWEDLLGSRRAGQYREWRVPPLAAGGLRLVGRCDRVERLDDGSLLILDYKRGSTSRYGQALQGAVYALALQEAGWPVAGYAYICHSDGGVKGVFAGEAHKLLKRPRKGNTPLEQKLDSAREKLEEMAADLRAGRYSLNRKSDSCAACGFRALCRRDEAPEEGAS